MENRNSSNLIKKECFYMDFVNGFTNQHECNESNKLFNEPFNDCDGRYLINIKLRMLSLVKLW